MRKADTRRGNSICPTRCATRVGTSRVPPAMKKRLRSVSPGGASIRTKLETIALANATGTPMTETHVQRAFFVALLLAVSLAFFWLIRGFLQPIFWAVALGIVV